MSDAPWHPGDTADAQSQSDCDQTSSDADQTASDLNQTSSDADQLASDRDQEAADRDQEAADSDQATADSDEATGDVHRHEDDAEYARTRRARSQSALERDATAQARSDTSGHRDVAATTRDQLANERDVAAKARDALATALDAEMVRLERDSRGDNSGFLRGADLLLRAATFRNRAAASRALAAEQRQAAAADRRQAAEDRLQAAQDRASIAAELAAEGIDHLTGTLRRRVGLATIQREMDRTDRTGEPLVLAFVDVVGLKQVNDTVGHSAGDELLREVARTIDTHLRTYDVVARFGGDEFVCSLTGIEPAGAAERFAGIAKALADLPLQPSISVGFAEREPGEHLDGFIRRADLAMIGTRNAPRA